MEYKGRIQLLSTKPQMIYRRILWCWGQKVFCPQLMPTNCSVAKQLPQFYKHSKSADLLRKSLLSTLRFGRCKTNIHWMFCTSCLAGPKFKSLIVQARTAFWAFDPDIILLNRYRTYVRFFACVYSSIKFADCQSFFLSVEWFWQICRKGFCFLYRKSSRMASAALIINVSYVSSQYFSTTSPCFL